MSAEDPGQVVFQMITFFDIQEFLFLGANEFSNETKLKCKSEEIREFSRDI